MNPYLVRVVYFILGTIMGATFGCGGTAPKVETNAQLVMVVDPYTNTATFKCVGFEEADECLALLRGNDGLDGKDFDKPGKGPKDKDD